MTNQIISVVDNLCFDILHSCDTWFKEKGNNGKSSSHTSKIKAWGGGSKYERFVTNLSIELEVTKTYLYLPD